MEMFDAPKPVRELNELPLAEVTIDIIDSEPDLVFFSIAAVYEFVCSPVDKSPLITFDLIQQFYNDEQLEIDCKRYHCNSSLFSSVNGTHHMMVSMPRATFARFIAWIRVQVFTYTDDERSVGWVVKMGKWGAIDPLTGDTISFTVFIPQSTTHMPVCVLENNIPSISYVEHTCTLESLTRAQ